MAGGPISVLLQERQLFGAYLERGNKRKIYNLIITIAFSGKLAKVWSILMEAFNEILDQAQIQPVARYW